MTTPVRSSAPPAPAQKQDDRQAAIDLARRYPVCGGPVAPQKVPWLGRPHMKKTVPPKT